MSKRDDARFWSKADLRDDNTCWIWLGGLTWNGYGEFKALGVSIEAHRYAYEYFNGDLEPHSVIRHSCDNRRCVNPAHLSQGTHADNVKDRVERGRSAVGEKNGRAVLTEKDVRHIRSTLGSNEMLARTYGVDPSTIKQIRTHQTWKHVE